MQVTITKQDENKLLKRKEVSAEVTFEGATPSNAVVAAEIAGQTKAKSVDLVVMNTIQTKFSAQKASVSAYVYDDEEAKGKSTRLTKHMKKQLEEQKKKEEEERKKAAEEKKKAEEEAKAAAEAQKSEESPAQKEAKEETKVEGSE